MVSVFTVKNFGRYSSIQTVAGCKFEAPVPDAMPEKKRLLSMNSTNTIQKNTWIVVFVISHTSNGRTHLTGIKGL